MCLSLGGARARSLSLYAISYLAIESVPVINYTSLCVCLCASLSLTHTHTHTHTHLRSGAGVCACDQLYSEGNPLPHAGALCVRAPARVCVRVRVRVHECACACVAGRVWRWGGGVCACVEMITEIGHRRSMKSTARPTPWRCRCCTSKRMHAARARSACAQRVRAASASSECEQ